MNFYLEPAKRLPVLGTADVLVVGGGPSGIAAAIAAARMGCDTLLLERFGCFGGMITTVGVESVAWWRHKNTVDAGGIAKEFEDRASAMGASAPEPQSVSQAINAEMFKVVADAMLEEAGVRKLLHIFVADVIREGGKLGGIITESKSGRQAIFAKIIVDCTGDADIAAYASAPYRMRPKQELMCVTTVFSCSNVDKERFMEDVKKNPVCYGDWGKDEENRNWSYTIHESCQEMFSPYLGSVFSKGKKAGLIPPHVALGGSWCTLTDHGDANYLNVVSMANVSCLDVEDLTAAETEGRKQALLAIEVLRQYQPGFEKAVLKNFGMTLGVRESRHILGRKRISENDIRNQGRHPDSIGVFPEFIDGNGMLQLPLEPRYFQIPYGALLPQNVDNLLVCGRAVDADDFAYATIRNMGACVVTGQGGGVAAAIALKADMLPHEIDMAEVQAALRAQNVRID